MIEGWTDPEDRLLARRVFGTEDSEAARDMILEWTAAQGFRRARVTAIELSAGRPLLLRGALANGATDHDQPGGDPDARCQGLARRRCQATDGLDGREPGPHRALGLVL